MVYMKTLFFINSLINAVAYEPAGRAKITVTSVPVSASDSLFSVVEMISDAFVIGWTN